MNENYPLLFFPRVTSSVKTPQKGRYYQEYRVPSCARRREILGPQFQALRDAMDSGRIHIQEGADGIDPEMVLVLETIGRIDDFACAVRKIEGLEWLGDFDIDDIEPDADYYDGEDPSHPLPGRLYLVSTNTVAMQQLYSLWQRSIDAPDEPFDRGLGRFKQLFEMLHSIRRWDVQDRFLDTKIRDYWYYQISNHDRTRIRFEIELWFKSNEEQRNVAYQSVAGLLGEMQGQIIARCEISEIRYSAILAELPKESILSLLDNPNVSLLKCDSIMFFRPSGQMLSLAPSFETVSVPAIRPSELQPGVKPIAGVFDGYPQINHSCLANRIIVDDPDGYGDAYKDVTDMIHGTSMCSLIVKGDLSENNEYITSPVYVRPIMIPDPYTRDKSEYIPENHLLVDVIHRAVKRMFEGENGEPPVAPTVKVINFSIGDPARMFYQAISPLAKMLDWLANKYSVLFVISTGNISDLKDLPCNKIEFESSTPIQQASYFAREILKERRNLKIFAPAESINNITVGAVHKDSSTIRDYDPRVNPYQMVMPATYSLFGPGARGCIKPDLVYDGGRELFREHVLHFSPLSPQRFPKAGPGIFVAAPGPSCTEAVYSIGTSNSAALVTRAAVLCDQTIEQLAMRYNFSQRHRTLLIKAMLVHGSSWGELGDNIERVLDPALDAYQKKMIKTPWIGYGYPDWEKSNSCNMQRATVIGVHSLKKEKADIFYYPIPECLHALTEKRKLTVTLAWFSPISADNQKYRKARLWVDVESGNFISSKEDVANKRMVGKGTLFHEVFYGEKATPIGVDDVLTIKVTCDKDAANITESIDYALMVSLEVAPGIDLPIYQEIQEKIAQQVPIRVDGMA